MNKVLVGAFISVFVFAIEAILALILYRCTLIPLFGCPDMSYFRMCALMMLLNIFFHGSLFYNYETEVVEIDGDENEEA